MNVEYLTLEDLLALAEDLGVPKIRDLGLLDSAAHRPQTSLMGQDAYPTLHEKAAVLLESVVRNHPLVDGNKRLGWMAMLVFYGLNGHDLDAPDDPAYYLVIEVATGAIDYVEAAARLAKWTGPRFFPPR
ncbi:type II toxin-antitoxin system death-on-curing family toxin [Actinokineospora iranica]|uniref:Death on curing protein n=1 Tax=Actinokineospora iranica TaxID=1271860 RepID=A0A1G6SYH0_9PSEU|nr:type II toxin-antitoxin system death-on-curing family toxin [Actinokineospora iranica]SDD22010.1 death on curing protein [Actinokineospora iranica]